MFNLVPNSRSHNLIGYNPFREFENFERELFEGSSFYGFKTDIEDMGDSYKLEADLPGVKRSDIDIDINGGWLTINAKRENNCESKDKCGNYLRRERSYGAFSRSFDVSSIRTDDIKASFNDGVLTLNMPKRDTVAQLSRKVQIQ